MAADPSRRARRGAAGRGAEARPGRAAAGPARRGSGRFLRRAPRGRCEVVRGSRRGPPRSPAHAGPPATRDHRLARSSVREGAARPSSGGRPLGGRGEPLPRRRDERAAGRCADLHLPHGAARAPRGLPGALGGGVVDEALPRWAQSEPGRGLRRGHPRGQEAPPRDRPRAVGSGRRQSALRRADRPGDARGEPRRPTRRHPAAPAHGRGRGTGSPRPPPERREGSLQARRSLRAAVHRGGSRGPRLLRVEKAPRQLDSARHPRVPIAAGTATPARISLPVDDRARRGVSDDGAGASRRPPSSPRRAPGDDGRCLSRGGGAALRVRRARRRRGGVVCPGDGRGGAPRRRAAHVGLRRQGARARHPEGEVVRAADGAERGPRDARAPRRTGTRPGRGARHGGG